MSITATPVDLFALHVGICGGDTMSLTGERVPTAGYMVSLPDCERRVRLRDLSRELPGYIERYASELHRRGAYLGGWVDSDGLVCLDVSVCIQDYAPAVRLGREWGQVAIYDLDVCESVYL